MICYATLRSALFLFFIPVFVHLSLAHVMLSSSGHADIMYKADDSGDDKVSFM